MRVGIVLAVLSSFSICVDQSERKDMGGNKLKSTEKKRTKKTTTVMNVAKTEERVGAAAGLTHIV